MWTNVCVLLKFSLTSTSQSPNPSTSNTNISKNKSTDDGGFIQSSKIFKPAKLNHMVSEISTEHKFNSLNQNLDNETKISKMETTIEPKPQPIFMKMVENYISITEEIENERNTKFKKKINAELFKFILWIFPNTEQFKKS